MRRVGGVSGLHPRSSRRGCRLLSVVMIVVVMLSALLLVLSKSPLKSTRKNSTSNEFVVQPMEAPQRNVADDFTHRPAATTLEPDPVPPHEVAPQPTPAPTAPPPEHRLVPIDPVSDLTNADTMRITICDTAGAACSKPLKFSTVVGKETSATILRAQWSPSHKGYSLRFEASGTFVGRTQTGNLVGDQPEAKSFEHWTFEAPGKTEANLRATASQCSHSVMLRPVKSAFQPEAAQWCVFSNFSHDQNDGRMVVGDARRKGQSCSLFCIYRVEVATPRHPHSLETIKTIERERDETILKSARSIGVALVTSLASVEKLQSKRVEDKELAKTFPTHWDRQVAVFQRWLQLKTYTDGNSAAESNCPFRVVEHDAYGMPVEPVFYLDVLICCEVKSDVDLLVREHSDLFIADGPGRDAADPRLVLTSECEVHSEFGIPTYRGLFALGERLIAVEEGLDLVMYSNSDILYSLCELRATVVSSAAAFVRRRVDAEESDPDGALSHLFITGRRRNCEGPDAFLTTAVAAVHHHGSGGGDEAPVLAGGASWDDIEVGPSQTYPTRRVSCDALWRRRWITCPLFEDTAQDYFIVSRGALRWSEASPHADDDDDHAHQTPKKPKKTAKWDSVTDIVPPLVVGGIAFDNWLVSTLIKRPDVFTVDATNTINALHLNHGGAAGLRQSHKEPKSVHNSRLAHEAGGWIRGKVTLAPYSSVVVEGATTARSLSAACLVAIHERQLLSCAGNGNCRFLHSNQDGSTDPPSAFDRPWERPD